MGPVRRFLLLSHRIPSNGAFTLNDLAGGGGRMDEVARCASTAFTLSNDLRRDTELTILFRGPGAPRPRRVFMTGARLKFLNPDERSTAALIKNALVRSLAADGEVGSSPGLSVGPVEPLEELRRFLQEPGVLWLTESGSPIEEHRPVEGGFAAVLSDPFDPPEDEVGVLQQSGAIPVSVGPRSLRSSQCIDLVHGWADRPARRVG